MENDINFFKRFYDNNLPIKYIGFSESFNGSEKKIINKLTNKTHFLIVSDQITYKLLGKKLFENIKKTKKSKNISRIILRTKVSNINSVYYISKFVKSSTILIAIGSGTINEICKYTAYLNKKDYIVFPTAPTNAFASNTASITINKIKKSFKAKFPIGILIDLNIAINCPKKLINSSFFDLVCRITAQSDCYLSSFLFNQTYEKTLYKKFIDLEKKIIKNYDKIFFEKKFLKELFRACIIMGLTTFKTKSSKFGSMSEHMISHYLDMFKDKSNLSTHGEQVALTTKSMLKLQMIFFRKNKAPKIFFLKNEENRIKKIFKRKNPVYFIKTYNSKSLSINEIEKINHKLKHNWLKLKKEFNKISSFSDDLLKIYKINNINYKKYGFSKKLYVEAILYSKYLRDRFTILDICDNAKILSKNINKII